MRPEYLASGEVARLIPAVSESNKEVRLLSPVLAALRIVPELADAILRPMGQRIGSRTSVSTFAEVVFKGKDASGDRPDGLIAIDTSRSVWLALVEAKHGRNELQVDQVERYLELARKCDIDAVITISNQFTATPTHSPVSVSAALTRKVGLFHLSWAAIRTEVELLLASQDLQDPERRLVLEELNRYLSHDSSSITGFTQMNSGWKEVIRVLSARGRLAKADPMIVATAADWVEEQRDLCLILTRKLQTAVDLRISRKHADSQNAWIADIAAELVDDRCLRAEFDVPDAAAHIELEVFLGSKTMTTSMRLRAPEDRKSTRARVNWVVRQLSKADDKRIVLRVNFPGRRESRDLALEEIRERPEVLDGLEGGAPCVAIEVLLIEEMGARFNGNRTFIDALEAAFGDFYDQVAQHLKGWQPAPPKPVKPTISDEGAVDAKVEGDAAGSQLGNSTKNLLWEVLRER